MPAVIFDLDGTLVDSAAAISRAFRWSAAACDELEPDDDAVRALVGRPLAEMYAVLVPDGDVESLIEAYRVRYRELLVDTEPFDGIPELLDALATRGLPLGIATTKRSPLARAVVEAAGLAEVIDHVQGTDPPMAFKPAPDVVRATLGALGVTDGWMIGDTGADVAAGRACGLTTIGVVWGTDAPGALEGAGADEIASDISRLGELLDVAEAHGRVS